MVPIGVGVDGEKSKPKTPLDVDVNVLSESEEEDEEDLVRIQDSKNPAHRRIGASMETKLSRNTDWPGHLIAGYSRKRRHPEFSPESSETEYSLEPEISMSINSPFFEMCDCSDSVGLTREVIILLSSDSESDVEILEG